MQSNASGSFLQTCIKFVEQRLKSSHTLRSVPKVAYLKFIILTLVRKDIFAYITHERKGLHTPIKILISTHDMKLKLRSMTDLDSVGSSLIFNLCHVRKLKI